MAPAGEGSPGDVVAGPSDAAAQSPARPLEIARHLTFHGTDHSEIEEKRVHTGNKHLELRHEPTQEDKELSRANYDHLEKQKSPGSEKDDQDHVSQVDIIEHRLSATQLVETLSTNFDAKVPGSSHGLTAEDAAARLTRDGPNVLTPPKKKSALQKVRAANR